jgi:hypothetical protein
LNRIKSDDSIKVKTQYHGKSQRIATEKSIEFYEGKFMESFLEFQVAAVIFF